MASKTGKDSTIMASAGVPLMVVPAAAQDAAEKPREVLQRHDTSSFGFASTFQGEDALRTGEWVLSDDVKYAGQESRVRVVPCDLEGGIFPADRGILLDEPHKHYGLGASFDKPISNEGKDLVIQYEVQMRNGVTCGGAYIKLLRGDAGADMKQLKNDSPYSIMFGPDKCGRDTNKVHFIFQHENPVTKEWEEKHFEDAPKIKGDNGFHVYTLHVKPDNTFDIYIDTDAVSTGNLLEDFSPAVNPDMEIDDPEDEQPEDWVTTKQIRDPEASKPDDWDEDAPRRIVDEEAEMPEGWLEDANEHIVDPKSMKPQDWDEEEDGEWEPVMMANPACAEAPGCGKWSKPTIPNPEYKGRWKAPMIDNPAYKGPWEPRKIPNPHFFEDSHPSNMASITGLAVEIWSVDGGIWMDNFVVGDDIAAALGLAEKTWRPKLVAYEAKMAADKNIKDKDQAQKKKKQREGSAPSALVSSSRALADNVRPYLPSSASPMLDFAGNNPLACIVTLLAGGMAVLFMGKKKKRTRASRPSPPAAAVPDQRDVPQVKEEEEEEEKEKEDKDGDGEHEGEGDDQEEEENQVETDQRNEGLAEKDQLEKAPISGED